MKPHGLNSHISSRMLRSTEAFKGSKVQMLKVEKYQIEVAEGKIVQNLKGSRLKYEE